ncbi:unnamed protein product [marine sediment metagenome]|uniref:Uncharacterized protein n=1 Tax=marine sediment metagenome TaxID=412755 RepID=X1GI98_9ZZZZ
MKQAAASWKGGRKKSSTSRKTSSTSRSRTKGRVRKVGKNGFNTQKIMKYIRMASLATPIVAGVAQHGMTIEAAKAAMKGYTGVDLATGQFDLKALIAGWTPFVAATAVTYGVPKLAGIIRGL